MKETLTAIQFRLILIFIIVAIPWLIWFIWTAYNHPLRKDEVEFDIKAEKEELLNENL